MQPNLTSFAHEFFIKRWGQFCIAVCINKVKSFTIFLSSKQNNCTSVLFWLLCHKIATEGF